MRSLSLMLILSLTAALVAACSTATSHKIDTESLSPHWQDKPVMSLLVVGVYDDKATRVAGESVFVDELNSRGIKAITSYDVFPHLRSLADADAVRSARDAMGFDAVLTVATIDTAAKYNPEEGHDTQGWLYVLGFSNRPMALANLGDEVDYYASGNFILDIGLWDPNTLQPIWNATTKSYDMDDGPQSAKALADFVVDTLRERGLI